MTSSKVLWAAVTLMAVTLSGCTDSGDDVLGMTVTGGADPLTDPFKFKATGPSAEQYIWDLGDGTILEGKEVEHVYGFTDGDITVKLQACTAGECESILRLIPLGGGKNLPPAGAFAVTSNWAEVGETFVLDASASTDSNGDPILYRWSCERLEDLRPPDDGGGHSHGPPGVPFGVNALASYDASLSGGDDHGDNLCADFAVGASQPWSATAATISGQFTEPGLYRWDVFVRDPKSAAWIGRLDLYVSPAGERPEPESLVSFSGTLPGGSGGNIDEQCSFVQAQGGPECPTTDWVEHPFTVQVPNDLATVTFTGGGTTGNALWGIKAGETVIVAPTDESPKFLAPLTFINGREYTVVFTTDGPSANVPYNIDIVIENQLDPRHLYQLPPA